MANMHPGTFRCQVLSAKVDKNAKKLPSLIIRIELLDGPNAGQQATYVEPVEGREQYVEPAARAVGWKGSWWKKVEDDCAAWIAATGGQTVCEIKRLTAKATGDTFSKVGSIGAKERVYEEMTDDDWERLDGPASGGDAPF